MLISKPFEKITNCLNISESMNLTTKEQADLCLELVRNFNKLLKLLLTKNEKNTFKKKVNIIKKLPQLQKLKEKIDTPNKKIGWQFWLGIKSNLLLKYSKNNNLILSSIYQDLSKLLPKPMNQIKPANFYSIEYFETTSIPEVDMFFLKLNEEIKTNQLKHIIIESNYFLNIGLKNILNHIEHLMIHLSGSLIIDVSKSEHFNDVLSLIEFMAEIKSCDTFGLSIPVNHKKSIKHIHTLFSKLTNIQSKRLILRLKKGGFKTSQTLETKKDPSYKQAIKLNTQYKWSIFTIMNYARKNHCTCIIHSNNLYDISWGLIMRAQMNLEKKIRFETNISKFPNIAKLVYMVNQASIHTESLLLEQPHKKRIHIILNKLIHQGKIYEANQHLTENKQTIFRKSHQQFFNYLNHNYLEKYLNAFDD